MVRSALPSLPLSDIDLLIIENVGNLVCPAEFRVGEDARVMVSSVTEGEDKPLKYPLMFRACELVIVNKIDLLEHLDWDRREVRVPPRRRSTRALRACTRARRRGRGSTRSGLARRAHDRGRALRRDGGRPVLLYSPHGGESRVLRRGGGTEHRRASCHEMSEALPPEGGRAAGHRGVRRRRGRTRGHVAVEFVHPVIVGQARADPRFAFERAEEVALMARPDDMVLAFDGQAPPGWRRVAIPGAAE
jgi:hypothetical protein